MQEIIIPNRFQKVNKWGELGYDILATYEKYQNFHNACDSLDQLGARGFLEYKGEEDPGNPFLNWKNGFSTLIDFLSVSIQAFSLLVIDLCVALIK